MNETTLMIDLVNAQQANQKLLRIIENLKPTDLRDQFAMAALTGNLQFFADHDVTDFREIATDCYNMADAMLKAREE